MEGGLAGLSQAGIVGPQAGGGQQAGFIRQDRKGLAVLPGNFLVNVPFLQGFGPAARQAELIARKLKGMPGHVNLIPLNDVAESPLKPSLPETVLRFQKTLEAHGIPATVRRTLGSDINASCGQLRRKFEQQTNGKEC